MSEGKMKWYKYLDPFFPYDKLIEFLKKKNLSNKYSDFIIFIIYALILAYLILALLALILGSHEAMMIVVSGSMEPKLNVGDIVVLKSPKTINTTYIDVNFAIKNRPINEYIKVNYILENGLPKIKDLNVSGQTINLNLQGDIVVYYSDLQKKEIIHRAVLGIKATDGIFYITKGDNEKTNFVLDADCRFSMITNEGLVTINCLYPYALEKEDVLSKHFFKIPYLGWVKLGPAYIFGWRA
jgi:signal peptidase I